MSVPMALVDFIPVILFIISAITLQRGLYYRMSKGAFAVFSAGTIMVICAGIFKASWKLLYGAGICDFARLNQAFFPMQSVGFLLAGIAPRRVYVASAAEDSWADPLSEQTAAEAAREVFAKLGLPRSFIGSHVRPGGHALARQDWLHYMDYIDKYMLDSEKKG